MQNVVICAGGILSRAFVLRHRRPAAFFVEYSILNPALGAAQPILGQHPYYRRHGMKPSYLCMKAGVFPKDGDGGLQLQSYYPMTALQVAQDPFYMQIEDCVLSENRISGAIEISEDTARHRSLMTDAGSFVWNLEMHKAVAAIPDILPMPFSRRSMHWKATGTVRESGPFSAELLF